MRWLIPCLLLACAPDRAVSPEPALEVPVWAQGYWNRVDQEGDAVHLTSFELLDGGDVLMLQEGCWGSDTGASPNPWFSKELPALTWQWGPGESIEILKPADYPDGSVPFGQLGARVVPGTDTDCESLRQVALFWEQAGEIESDERFERGLVCYPSESCPEVWDWGLCAQGEMACPVVW